MMKKTGKKVAIVQSNYIPWKGYFDMINMVDEFILFDDMQYTRRDWRNRNRVKTQHGTIWLTIPVEVKGKYSQRICETRTTDNAWRKSHWSSIVHSYSKAPFFKEYRDLVEDLYLGSEEQSLSLVNHSFLVAINGILGIETRLTWSMDYEPVEGKTERLVGLCKQAGATEYISGPAARDYIVPEVFSAEGIELTWMDYGGYPEYDQIHPPFEHAVSVLDLIFNQGKAACKFMKSFDGVSG
jgi:hypothetical protein